MNFFNRLTWIFAKGLKILLNPPAIKHSNLHKTCKVCAKSELTNCKIGKYSYIGYQTSMVDVEIGSFCSIAGLCSIGGATHPMEYVSTSPVFHVGKNILKNNFAEHPIRRNPLTKIDHDVWIGHGAKIKAGVHIYTGAVIGMGSVVTHNVGPYEIWAGNPARLIRKRFDEDVIKKLLESKWWEFNNNQLKEISQFFNNPIAFIETWSERIE